MKLSVDERQWVLAQAEEQLKYYASEGYALEDMAKTVIDDIIATIRRRVPSRERVMLLMMATQKHHGPSGV